MPILDLHHYNESYTRRIDMWRTIFRYDPIPALLISADDVLFYTVQRDLLAGDGEDRKKM